jgi:MFS family permease
MSNRADPMADTRSSSSTSLNESELERGGVEKTKDQTFFTDSAHDTNESPDLPQRHNEDATQSHKEKRSTVLEQVVSTASSKPSVNDAAAAQSVPDGGLKAWLQVLGGFFIYFNTWGIINAFGTYQTFYESDLLSKSTPSDISWIGSLQAFLLMLFGCITGPIYDAGYARALLLVGSFLIVFGQMMLSLCTEYWQVVLAQGVAVGLGAGCLFVPSMAILSTYFRRKMATAMGLAATGSSIGGLLYPIIFYKLQPQIGFAWATRVIGFIVLATLVVSNVLMKVRVLPATRRKVLDLAAYKEPPYLLFNLGCFLGFIGLYAPFFYVSSYSINTGIMGKELAFYLLSILNAASTFGRLIPNVSGSSFSMLIAEFEVSIEC